MIVLRKPMVTPKEERDARCKSVPSADRIEELCAQIQQTWSLRERQRRAGMDRYLRFEETVLSSTRRKGFWGD